MTFQFNCPQGHLLEGDPSQAGQQCTCPQCGQLFVIPAPPAAPSDPPGGLPDLAAPPQQSFPDVSPQFPAAQTPFDPFAQPAGPKLLHIPCPNGHELETPPDMLDLDVMCPHCGVQFTLREKDSEEYKRKRRAEEERQDEKAGRLWFNWAVGIAVFVLIGLIMMIAISNG